MTRGPLPFALLLLVGLTLVAPASRGEVLVPEIPTSKGSEDDFQRAKAASRDFDKAIKRRRYKAALAHAENAYGIYKSPSFALMAALAHSKQNDHDREAFRWYLQAKALKPPSVLLEQIDKGLAEHGPKAQLGVLVLEVTPEGATVAIDRAQVRSWIVGATYGEHDLVVSAAGYKSVERKVQAAAATVTVRVDLDKLPKKVDDPPPPEKLPPPPPEEESSTTWLGWTLGGVGVGLTVAGAVLFVLADQDVDAMDALDFGAKDFNTRYDELDGRVSGRRVAGGVLTALGAASLIGGVVYLVLESSDSPTVTLQPHRSGAMGVASWQF